MGPQNQTAVLKGLSAKWASTMSKNKHGLILKTKDKLVDKEIRRVRVQKYLQTFHLLLSSPPAKTMPSASDKHGSKCSNVDSALVFVCVKLDAEI